MIIVELNIGQDEAKIFVLSCCPLSVTAQRINRNNLYKYSLKDEFFFQMLIELSYYHYQRLVFFIFVEKHHGLVCV